MQSSSNSEFDQIAAQRLGASEDKILVRGGSYGRYIQTGAPDFLPCGRHYGCTVQPRSPGNKRHACAGDRGGHVFDGNHGSSAIQFFRAGLSRLCASALQPAAETLVWVDRHGSAQPLPAPPRVYRGPRVSPTGLQVAVGIGNDVWIYDIPRDTLTRLTFDGNSAATSSAWTPDGKRVVYLPTALVLSTYLQRQPMAAVALAVFEWRHGEKLGTQLPDPR